MKRFLSAIAQHIANSLSYDSAEKENFHFVVRSKIYAHGAKREKNGPVPISAGRDPISPAKRRPSFAYALSLPRSLNAQFSSSTRSRKSFGSYLMLQFCFSSFPAEVDRSRSIGARHRRKFIIKSLSSTKYNLADVRYHYRSANVLR